MIRWKDTIADSAENIQHLLERHQDEIKHAFYKNGVHRIIWKDTWMPETSLKDTCDELLGAYLLIKMYNCTIGHTS